MQFIRDHILSIILFLPLAGMIALLFIPSENKNAIWKRRGSLTRQAFLRWSVCLVMSLMWAAKPWRFVLKEPPAKRLGACVAKKDRKQG